MDGVPEGDTVWLAAQRMNTALAGATLRRGELRVPQLAGIDLTGATVTEVVPRGKHMLTRLADGRTLRTHYRMDGSWHIYRRGRPWRGGPGHAVRAVLATDVLSRAAADRLAAGSLRGTAADWTCEDPRELEPWGLRLAASCDAASPPAEVAARLPRASRALAAALRATALRGERLARYEIVPV